MAVKYIRSFAADMFDIKFRYLIFLLSTIIIIIIFLYILL